MIKGTRMMMKRGAPLPYDARVLYVETDGGSYINTGVTPTTNSKVSVTFASLELENNKGIFGSRNGSTRLAVSFGAFIQYSTAVNRISFAGPAFARAVPLNPWNSNIHDATIDAYSESGTVKITVDGLEYAVSSTISTTTTSFMLGVFGDPSMYSDIDTTTNARFYSCKIYTNGVLVFDGIPVRKNGQGYIYDRVSGRLCGNAGASGTTVTYGADVPFDEYVEYLDSTSNEYVNTTIIPADGIRLSCDFAIINSDASSYVCGSIPAIMRMFAASYNPSTKKFSIGMHCAPKNTGEVPLQLGDRHALIIDSTSGAKIATLDGVEIATDTGTDSTTESQDSAIVVFNANLNGQYNSYTSKIRIFSFSATDTRTNEKLVDLWPVRFTNDQNQSEGAMYDRAHPTGGTLGNGLYPNLGTGAFTIGADKS